MLELEQEQAEIKELTAEALKQLQTLFTFEADDEKFRDNFLKFQELFSHELTIYLRTAKLYSIEVLRKAYINWHPTNYLLICSLFVRYRIY